jgi:hypothetical protein
MRLYIAGPMTGLPNYNFDAFNRTAIQLAADGHEVYNPASSFRGRQDLPYDAYIRHALQLVTMSEGIVLLSGWMNSRGALTEVHAGLSCDLSFFIVDPLVAPLDLIEIEMNYEMLAQALFNKYLFERELHAEPSHISEDTGGDSREAESGEDHTVGSSAGTTPGLATGLICETTEGRLLDHGGGDRRPQPQQEQKSITRHWGLFPWDRPKLVGESVHP